MQEKQQVVSSGSDSDPRYANMDDRKRKRMISNRESARRSRMKKQQHLDELFAKTNNLKSENVNLSKRIDVISRTFDEIESENNVLRAQIMELTDRLRSLNSVMQIVEQVSGFAMDIVDIPDTMLEPWQLPCVVQPLPNAF